jgi:hypothetical protein
VAVEICLEKQATRSTKLLIPMYWFLEVTVENLEDIELDRPIKRKFTHDFIVSTAASEITVWMPKKRMEQLGLVDTGEVSTKFVGGLALPTCNLDFHTYQGARISMTSERGSRFPTGPVPVYAPLCLDQHDLASERLQRPANVKYSRRENEYDIVQLPQYSTAENEHFKACYVIGVRGWDECNLTQFQLGGNSRFIIEPPLPPNMIPAYDVETPTTKQKKEPREKDDKPTHKTKHAKAHLDCAICQKLLAAEASADQHRKAKLTILGS